MHEYIFYIHKFLFLEKFPDVTEAEGFYENQIYQKVLTIIYLSLSSFIHFPTNRMGPIRRSVVFVELRTATIAKLSMMTRNSSGNHCRKCLSPHKIVSISNLSFKLSGSSHQSKMSK